jgi:hypothetical protein
MNSILHLNWDCGIALRFEHAPIGDGTPLIVVHYRHNLYRLLRDCRLREYLAFGESKDGNLSGAKSLIRFARPNIPSFVVRYSKFFVNTRVRIDLIPYKSHQNQCFVASLT